MTDYSIPHMSGKNAGNSQEFSSAPQRPLTEEERVQAEVDRYVVKTLALQNDEDLNSGQTDLIAFARFSCKTYGFCARDKFIKNFVASRKNKRHINEETTCQYLRHVTKYGFILTMMDVHGKKILISDARPARMEKVFRAKTTEKAEAEASERRVAQAAQERQQREKLAFLDLARRAASSAEEPPAADGDAQDFAGNVENPAAQAESFDDKAAKDSHEDGEIFPSAEMEIDGGINPGTSAESVVETTTKPIPPDPCEVGESRAREDALAGEDVVVVENPASEDLEQEALQDEDAPRDDDPFLDDQKTNPRTVSKPGTSSAGPAGSDDGNAPAPTPKAAKPSLEAAKKDVLKLAPPTVNEVALSTVILNIADTFQEDGIQVRHVEAMIGTVLKGVPTAKIVKRLGAALKAYQEAEDNPTVKVGKPWGFYKGIVKNVHADMTKAEGSEPVVHLVENKIAPEFTDEQKAQIKEQMDALDDDGMKKLLADTATLMMPDLRDSKPLVERNARKLTAERLGIAVKPWKATPEKLAAAVPAASRKQVGRYTQADKVGRYTQSETKKPIEKLPPKPDDNVQSAAQKAYQESPDKAKYRAMAEAEFAANFPGVGVNGNIIDQRAANLYSQARA